MTGFKEITKNSFSPIATMYHYLNSSKKHFEDISGKEAVKLKKYLYCLRSTLAGLWLLHYKTVPPMELSKLLFVIKENQMLVEKVNELVALKATKNESYLHPQDFQLEEFLKQSVLQCENAALSLPSITADGDGLNTFFIKSL